MKQAITITDGAAEQIRNLLASRGKESAGVKVGVKKGGCSGLAYTIEFADEIRKWDEVVEDKGVKVIIDPKATLYLIGTEMDFQADKFKSGFTFTNPNERAGVAVAKASTCDC